MCDDVRDEPQASGPPDASFLHASRAHAEGCAEDAATVAAECVASALRDARGMWLHPDPLPVEMLASGLAAVWRPDPLADDEREEAFGGGLVSYLAEARTPDAMALLHALACVAGGTVSEKARFAARTPWSSCPITTSAA